MAKSLRAAINAKCRDCIYDPLSGLGNWRQQVEACTSPGCPLFDVRLTSHRHKVRRGTETASLAAQEAR